MATQKVRAARSEQATRAACAALLALVFSAPFHPTTASAASVTRLEDHSLPRSKVKTYHFTCSNGRFGMVRVDTTVVPNSLCASVQDGSKPEACRTVSRDAENPAVAAAAVSACE